MSRGARVFLSRHDREHVLNIVDGCEQLAAELVVAPAALWKRISTVMTGVIANPDFMNVLSGLIAEPERFTWCWIA